MTLKDIEKANDIKKLKPEEYDAFAEEEGIWHQISAWWS